MLGIFYDLFVVCIYFSSLLFSKFSFWNNNRVSNSLDPDQGLMMPDQTAPNDLGLYCMHMYLKVEQDKVVTDWKRVNVSQYLGLSIALGIPESYLFL